MIPFGDYQPDRAPYAASLVATNTIPVADGHRPIKRLVAASSALAAAPRGAIRVRTAAGVVRVFAGTASALYELDGSTFGWTNVSGASPYAVPTGDNWVFTVFGDYLVASNLGTNHQYIDINSGTVFADVPGSPPRSRFTWVAGEYFCLGNITSAQKRVMTSGIGDLSWWTVGQRGCDFQDFPDGGEVMGGVSVNNGAVVFQRSKLRAMNMVQVGDYSFTTSELNPNRGTISPKSICQVGPGQFFYYSPDGFMMGPEGRPIGAERVDRTFASLLNDSEIEQIASAVDPVAKIVWTIPQGRRYLLGYNWQLDKWCSADIDILQLVQMATPTLSWDSGSVPIDTDTEAFDANPGNLDRFAAFDTSNRLCFFTGANLQATLETADTEFAPGRRAWLQEAVMVGDASSFTLTSMTMEKRGGTISTGNAVTPYGSTGICHFRSTGRFHRIKATVPEGATWSVMSGVEPTAIAEGRR